MSRFYLTTAIDYVNSRPHLGTAYEKIAADVIARYKRLCGIDTHFVMGNDEHSQNVFRKARELGEDPQAYCDRMAAEFLEVWKRLDISFDDDAENSLRGRCYGKTVEQVVRNAGAFNDAMREQGIASCGKHFPGYSAASSDAHYQLPRIDRTREELDQNELAVFRAMIGRGGSPNRLQAIEVNRPYLKEGTVDSMMICHGWYPCFDSQPTPATVSRMEAVNTAA